MDWVGRVVVAGGGGWVMNVGGLEGEKCAAT